MIPGAFVRFEDVPVGLWTPQRGVDLADSERQIAVAPKVLGHGRDAVELPLAILFDGPTVVSRIDPPMMLALVGLQSGTGVCAFLNATP